MATKLKTSTEFRYQNDDHDALEPYFEGVFEIEFSCTDKGDCYDVDIEEITLTEGVVWFDDEGSRVEFTGRLEKLAIAWFERMQARNEFLREKIRAKCIEQFEKERD